ncbi:hypothetical protein BpHYR1_038013 [Brachionus plicatilis]|uniref:Uncharacterized protein n=1 Tax=Brachionus plicatilis TaxID=10195 RepID=A0A3M7QPY4_BRAPC|nr:hypothetical protein BpHYR1_038013 [Brachionus plicatilis]
MDRLSRPCKPVWTDGLVGRVGRMGRTSRSRKQAWTDGRDGCCLDTVDYLGNYFLIVCISEKDACFSFERRFLDESFFNFIGQFLILYSCPFFDYSDMSLTWTQNFVKIVIFWPFSTIVTCRISRKR